MAEKRKICPTCHGKKTIAEFCQCSSEWRGSPQPGDTGGSDDCQCTPRQECPTCCGTGYYDASSTLHSCLTS